MDSEVRHRVEALRRPLEVAAADGFAGVRRVQGLGNALRVACDAILTKLGGATDEESAGLAGSLGTWRATLGTWEQLDEYQQAVEVARGMRLIARVPRPVGATIEKKIEAEKRAASSAAPARQTAMPSAKAPISRDAASRGPAGATGQRPGPGMATGTGRPLEPGGTNDDVDASAVEGPPSAGRTADAVVGAKVAARGKPASSPPRSTADADDPLGAPTYSLPGIGPALAEKLAGRNLTTVEDLLWLVPRRYDDVRNAGSLGDACKLDEGARATFVARVQSSRMVFGRGRRWGEVRLAGIEPGDKSSIVVRWFNVYGGIDKRMPAGSHVTLSGPVRRRNGRVEFANPDVLGVELPDGGTSGEDRPGTVRTTGRIIARYPDIAGVPAAKLRQVCATACTRVGRQLDDGVPSHVEEASQMPSLGAAIAHLHAPPPETTAEELLAMNRGDSRWQRRLAFGELFSLGIAVARRRRERRADAAVPCAPAKGLAAELKKAVPLTPTRAQRRAIDELGGDLARPVPMNRLLQGDVGSGKTLVAFAAALHVVRAGRQVAVMAPTELLAEQHQVTWRAWAAAVGLRIELLTASTPKGVRASLLALLGAGQIDVLIGTHALLSEGVGFAALGLVVIDEQHRFGVAQRVKLRDKGDGQGAPHLLVMTATPIPRTLALTAYGDLDVSTLDELPPGRTPIATKILSGARGKATAVKAIGERVAAVQRAYVVCPKVEPGEPDPDDDKKTWADATTTAAELAAALPTCRVGLVHGRLDGIERDRVMRAFKDGEVDVLVATTVIEVGVDVPAATLMVVLDADRFGLAQLHQLRGRVGRGTAASACLLVTQGAVGEEAGQRLDALVATTDGFRIAEEDLRLRGPGELLGPRQAGIPRLRFGNLAQHTELLLEARRHAEAVLDEDPDLVRPEHAALRRAIERRLAHHVYGADGG